MEDGRLLAVHLDNIIVSGKKLHVNLPHFQRFQESRNGEGGGGEAGEG